MIFGAIFVATYLVYRRHSTGYSSCSSRKLPPAMPSLPVVGSLPFLPVKTKDFVEFCISSRNKLGKIFSFRLGRQ